MRTAVVIGGGIGGLATAVGLARRGWDVRVHEQSPAFEEVGAGISIWGNALRALDDLDLGDAVRAVGAAPGLGGFRDKRGRWIMRGTGDEVLMLHRADLLKILLAAVPTSALRPGERIDRFDPATTDLLIGADGARSAVRRAFWPDAPQPEYVGTTAWRMVLPSAGIPDFDACETWGDGIVFGAFPMGDRLYCYAGAPAPEGERTDELAELRRRFQGWAEPIPSILAAVDPAAVLRHDVYTQPPLDTFAKDNVVLVGDAAHAMAPYLGQGGCQALEDAASLAILADQDDLAAGLREYDRIRRPRAQLIVKRSLAVLKMVHTQSTAAAVVRNAGLRLIHPAIRRLRGTWRR
ncbi:FAD-dependent monooxygenase [Actinokineospora sp. HUAS TT18]|uniref:FAD-dependent monooxygenase n=1 Tax=Actinokineospora sp. HUAS TT18 TaxID=3447451 RepID=UPI003F5259E0